jgi:hypothetical protein
MAAVSLRQKMMAKKKTLQKDWLFPNAALEPEDPDTSLLDVIDTVVTKGAVLNGDVILGVAGVDLIYTKLSVLLAAVDRLSRYPEGKTAAAPPRARRRKRRHTRT